MNKIFSTLIILIVLWSNYFLLVFITPENHTNLLKFVPTQADICIELKNDRIIKSLLYDVLFSNNISSTEIKEFNSKKSKSQFSNIGIDFSGDFVCFKEQWDKANIFGIIFYCSDDFVTNFNPESNKIYYSKNKNVGCIISVELNNPLAQQEDEKFAKYAKDLLHNYNNSEVNSFSNKFSNKQIAGLYVSNPPIEQLQNIKIEFSISDTSIIFNGHGIKNPTSNFSNNILTWHFNENKNEKLTITNFLFPDSLFYYLSSLNMEPHLNNSSTICHEFNLYQLGIENANNKIRINPYFDAIFEFNGIENYNNFLNDISPYYDSIQQNYFLGKEKMYLNKINDSIYHFGLLESPKIEPFSRKELFGIKGQLSCLTKIKGEGLIVNFLNLIPTFQNSKDFLTKIEDFQLKAEPKDDTIVIIEGEMSFHPDQSAIISIFQFLLNF